MSDKSFRKILAAVIILGMLGTIALAGYTVRLHGNSSIITYIGGEG